MSAELPPPGPERDRLVAEALGCTTWVRTDDPDRLWAGCFCAPDPPHDAALSCSAYNHAALDALEAWKRGGKGRRYTINCWSAIDTYGVALHHNSCHGYLGVKHEAPTLGDAASAAIIEAKRREG